MFHVKHSLYPWGTTPTTNSPTLGVLNDVKKMAELFRLKNFQKFSFKINYPHPIFNKNKKNSKKNILIKLIALLYIK